MSDRAGHDAVREAMTEVSRLQSALRRAYEKADAGAAEKLLAELSLAERRRNRAMQRALSDGGPSYDVTLPIREQVAQVLQLLGRPATVALIRDVAAARFGESIPGPRLASLRRDEARSWRAARSGQRSSSRPSYVVPALTYDRFAPVRGYLALSNWPLDLRLMAPTSARVDMLHAVDRLAAELAAAPDAPWAPEVQRLLWRFARTVPGAATTGTLDTGRVRSAVTAELAQLADTDAADRAEAAQRATTQLDEEQQLLGARLGVTRGRQAAGGM